jgi:hypothetical protein
VNALQTDVHMFWPLAMYENLESAVRSSFNNDCVHDSNPVTMTADMCRQFQQNPANTKLTHTLHSASYVRNDLSSPRGSFGVPDNSLKVRWSKIGKHLFTMHKLRCRLSPLLNLLIVLIFFKPFC